MPEHVCHCSVKIEELSVRKGSTEILNQVNLTANHGEILALIGRNGAGKTTLLKAILGQTPYSGRISYFNCQGKRIDRPRIGYVPQFLAFDRSTPVTVEDLFCANRSRIPVWMSHGKKRQKEAESLLEKVGGTGLFRKKLGALSGGELQRVLLAFALDPLPDLLLLDEPVSAVDRKGVGVFLRPGDLPAERIPYACDSGIPRSRTCEKVRIQGRLFTGWNRGHAECGGQGAQ